MKTHFFVFILLWCNLHSIAQTEIDTTEQLDSIMVLAKAVTPLGQPSTIHRRDWQIGKLASRAEEALQYLPGVHIHQRGVGQVSTLQYRGLQGARIAQTWQGIPVSNPQLGTSDVNELSLNLVDQISLGTPTNIGNAAAVSLRQTASGPTSLLVRYAEGNGYLINGQWNGLRILYQNDQHDFLHSLGGSNFESRETGITTKSLGASLTKRLCNQWSSSSYFLQTDRTQDIVFLEFDRYEQKTALQTTTGRQLFTWQPDTSQRIDLGILFDRQEYQTNNNKSSIGSTVQVLFVQQKQLSKHLNFTSDNRGLFTKHDRYNDKNILAETRTLLDYSTHLEGLKLEAIAGTHIRLKSGGVLFGSATLKKELSPSESVNLSIRRLGRIPSLDDLLWSEGGDIDLIPEKGWSISTSSTGKLGPIKVTPLVFVRRFSDYIIWLPRGTFWRPSSIPGVNNFGAGLDLSGHVENRSHKLYIKGSLSYSELRLTDDFQLFSNLFLEADKNLPFSPKFTSNLTLDYSFHQWSWLLQSRYTGKQETSYNGLSSSEKFAVFRSAISFHSNRISASISCDNITNTIIPNDFGLFSPLRRFELSLNYTPKTKT